MAASSKLLQWSSSFAKEAMKFSFTFTKFFCFLNVTNSYLFTAAIPYGPSMIPTLNLTGNLVIAERISTRFGKVGRGNIVLVRSPESPRKVVTKRVVGLEGDRVTYIVDPKNGDECKIVVVPKGHIWIEGDYTHNSRDSRVFGPVPYALLQGRMFWRILPLKDFGPLGPRPT